MKKIIILMFATLFMGGVVKANEVKTTDYIKSELTKDYNFIVDKSKLGEYLELGEKDTIQLNKVYKTYNVFCKGMLMAKSASSEKKRLKLIFNSLDRALWDMNSKLNKYQYKKFLSCLNKEFYDKGFTEESYLYCERKSK